MGVETRILRSDDQEASYNERQILRETFLQSHPLQTFMGYVKKNKKQTISNGGGN